MTLFALPLAMLVGMLAGSVVSANAQETTVAVQTRNGLSLELSQPAVEVTYTIIPPRSAGGAGDAPAPAGAMAPPGAGAGLGMLEGGGAEPQLSGSVSGLAKMFKPGVETLRARREKDSLTLYRGGVEIRIPVDSITSLTVSRQRVADSPLPPYVVVGHVRHAVAVVLTDGSTLEGDYVNFGTAVLSGTTPQGRVEIPLEDVERLRFNRK
jgi:hypothetical protein